MGLKDLNLKTLTIEEAVKIYRDFKIAFVIKSGKIVGFTK